MQPCLRLLSKLKEHKDSRVADWASKEERVFEEEIRSEREWEAKRQDARHDARFESFE
jgi:hypothetical protein